MRLLAVVVGCGLLGLGSPKPKSPRSRAPARAPDPYKTLGVTRKSSDEEIKSAYRSAALAWHPDKRPERRQEAEVKFKQISAAYQQIRDRESRLVYERERRAAAAPATPGAAPPPGGGGPTSEVRVPLRVSLEELLRGGSRVCTFEMPLSQFQRGVFVVPVKFEAGARPGDVVETRSHGSTLIHVVLEERPHAVFKRVGDDLQRTVWIQHWARPRELRLRSLESRRFVPKQFLDGDEETVVIKSKGDGPLRDGNRVRAKDRGLPNRDGLSRGDLVVTVRARSVASSAAVLAARASPLVAIVAALRNVTHSVLAAKEATKVAKKHGPRVLRILANVVTWKRLLDNMADFAQAIPAQ